MSYKKVFEDNADLKKLQKAVKNFNAKLDYVNKKNPENKKSMPERVYVKELKKQIGNRHDLNRVIRNLQLFSKRGMEKTVTTDNGFDLTLWEKTVTEKHVKKENAKRKKIQQQIDNAPVKYAGQEITGTRMAQRESLKPIKFNANSAKSLNDFRNFARRVEYSISANGQKNKNKLVTEYWLKSFATVFSGEQVKEMERLFFKIGLDKIAKCYYDGDEVASIDFIYEPQEADYIYDTLHDFFKQLANEVETNNNNKSP
jgi:hypothetical protein